MIPEGALDLFNSIGQGQGHPMDWLSIGIIAGRAEADEDIHEDGMNLIALMPELMARLFMTRVAEETSLVHLIHL